MKRGATDHPMDVAYVMIERVRKSSLWICGGCDRYRHESEPAVCEVCDKLFCSECVDYHLTRCEFPDCCNNLIYCCDCKDFREHHNKKRAKLYLDPTMGSQVE